MDGREPGAVARLTSNPPPKKTNTNDYKNVLASLRSSNVLSSLRSSKCSVVASLLQEDHYGEMDFKVRMGENKSCTATTTNAVLSVTRFARRSRFASLITLQDRWDKRQDHCYPVGLQVEGGCSSGRATRLHGPCQDGEKHNP